MIQFWCSRIRSALNLGGGGKCVQEIWEILYLITFQLSQPSILHTVEFAYKITMILVCLCLNSWHLCLHFLFSLFQIEHKIVGISDKKCHSWCQYKFRLMDSAVHFSRWMSFKNILFYFILSFPNSNSLFWVVNSVKKLKVWKKQKNINNS